MTKIENIRATLESAYEHLLWVREGMPYSMYDTDESLYLSNARNEIAAAISNLDTLDDVEDEDCIIFENPRSVWINAQQKKPRVGLLVNILTEKGFMCVTKYYGKNKGFIGWGDREITNVTHWAYLPMKSTAK